MALPAERMLVLPGDAIDPELIPTHPKNPLRLGPGLRHVPPSEIAPTVAGQLVTDPRKNRMWVEYNGGRYIPTVGDLVIGLVQRSAGDFYHVQLTDHTAAAVLPVLAFEMATKKTRPHLQPGALVYARVAMANRHMDPELECVAPATGKADGLGPLTGGMLYRVSPAMARRLLMVGGSRAADEARVVVLDELAAAGLAFETAVGRNGKVWVNSDDFKAVLAVGRAVTETDVKKLGIEEQKQLARKLVKELA